MARYYANITGAANIQVPFNPYQVYTGNGNYVRVELNCDNLRTDSIKGNGAVWLHTVGNWFSFEMYGKGWEYFNLGRTTYIGRYDYWSTSGFEETLVLEVNNGAVTLTKGQQTSATTFSGNFSSSNISFFPTTYGVNTRVNFYEWKAYGTNNTLLFDFVPDYNGTTKGLRDKVSGNFYAATDQSKIELVALSTFETDVTAITASYNSTTSSVTLTAEDDMAWTVSSSNNWITLSTTGGTGSSVFTVSLSKNTAYTQRLGTVSLTNGEDVIEIVCTQEKHPLLVPKNNIYREGRLVN